MKKLLLTALCLLGLFSLNAQTPETITVGSGSESFRYSPTYVYYKYSLTQQIFVADEMQNKSGKITSVSFKGTKAATRNLKIYMVNTDKTSFSGGKDWVEITEQDLVYSGLVNFIANDWTNITFQTPFTYKKGKNCVLCVNDVTGADQTSTTFFASDAKSETRLLYINDYSNGYDATNISESVSGTTEQKLNHVKFTIVDDGSGEILDEAPDNPTDLTAKALSDTEIELSWTASEKATSYKVYQKGNETAIASGISGTTYVVKDLTAGTNYCFTVTAVADQESEHSDEACAETLSKLTTFTFNFEEGSFYNNTLEGLRVYQGDGANPKQDLLNWGTVEDRIATGNPQMQKQFAGKDGSRAVYSMSIDPQATPIPENYYTPDNYIVTTKSYLITETSAIEWDIRQAVDGKEDNYAIVVSEDGVNFREVWVGRYSNGSGATKAILLTKEAGKELYIGFRHYEITYGGALILDNVKLVTESTLTPEDEYDPDAPGIPTKVEAVGWSETTLKVRWNAAQNAESYNIYSADTLVVKGVTATEYMVENLEPETNYCFRVSAVKGDKESAKSSEACDVTFEEKVTYLDAPTNLKATYASEYDIRLTWDKVEKADVYNVYQDGIYLLSVSGKEPTHLATNLDKNTTYCFEVTAVSGNDDNKVESDKSNKICTSIAELENSTDDEPDEPVVPENPTDTVPAAPVVTATATSDSTIVLTWNAVEGAESYNVYQGTDTVATAVKNTTYTVSGLTAETEYTFTVTAVNAAGESAKSAEVKATTLKAEGIEELSAAINIYPNPVQNELFLATEVRVEEVAIYDIYGRQQAISYQLSAVSSIDVADLEAGIYFVKVVTNNGEVVKRFIKN